MAYKNTELVDLPAHTVFLKNGKTKYVYLITRAFRNAKGQPDNERVSIGKLDEATGKLIPNKNYYQHFDKEAPQEMTRMVRSCGTYAVCRKIAEDTGLTDTLKTAFPEEYEQILTGAHYMTTSGSVMYYLDDWLDGTVSFSAKSMDDVTIGRVFKGITEEKKNHFFRSWMKSWKEKEVIAYDVTSISSYSEKLQDVEYGYNRDKEKLPQINYGMYYGEQSKIPVYYRIYPGSINDKAHFQYMISGTDWLGFSKAQFVFDRGMFDEENLKLLTDKGHRFISPVPMHLKNACNLIDKEKDSIINQYDCLLPDRTVFCKTVPVNWYGFRMNVHMFYEPNTIADRIEAFRNGFEQMKDDIAQMTTLPDKATKYYRYFKLQQKDKYVVAEEMKDEISKALTRCGFFLIAETVFSKSSTEIMDTYSDRDVIEKCFDDLKNEVDLSRIRCSKNETAAGKMFTAFISLILISQLRKNLNDYMRKKNLTLKKVLNELDKIKVIYDGSVENGCRLLNPITKTQRTILELLGIDEKVLINFKY